MKVTFYGAAHEVGRSCILIEAKNTKVLLDAGVKLGRVEEHPVIEDSELKSIDGIVISHAHLDHIGYLPHIYSKGFNGFIHTMKPTFELTNVLISDYMHISNPRDVTKEGLSQMQKHFKQVEYHEEFKIKDLTIKLVPAGHILGSAMIEVHDGTKRLLYTGDINLRSTRLLDPAYTKYLNAQTILTESTYGGDKDIFPPEKKVLEGLVVSIKETINRGGKLIMPCFATGRGQEILMILDDYMRSGLIPKVPIYIDGMINKAMRIHRHNVIYCRDELQKRILMSEDDPFKSIHFHGVATKQQRMHVIKSQEPCIIVTTSGMITGGPIIKYLETLSGDSKNRLVLVGYQAEGTLGRAISEGAKEINIEGKKVDFKMDVQTYHISAHADRPQLMSLFGRVENLQNIVIIHGEFNKSEQLANALKDRYNTVLPKLKESFEF